VCKTFGRFTVLLSVGQVVHVWGYACVLHAPVYKLLLLLKIRFYYFILLFHHWQTF